MILAIGFGLERGVEDFPATSYWWNDTLNQTYLNRSTPSATMIIGGFVARQLLELAAPRDCPMGHSPTRRQRSRGSPAAATNARR